MNNCLNKIKVGDILCIPRDKSNMMFSRSYQINPNSIGLYPVVKIGGVASLYYFYVVSHVEEREVVVPNNQYIHRIIKRKP